MSVCPTPIPAQLQAGISRAYDDLIISQIAFLTHQLNFSCRPVDEDPAIFAHIIKYLTNCGQQGAVELLPKDPQERAELRCACGGYITGPSFPWGGPWRNIVVRLCITIMIEIYISTLSTTLSHELLVPASLFINPRLMASRLSLPELERLLTPPSDIIGHYNEFDKGIKEREDAAIK